MTAVTVLEDNIDVESIIEEANDIKVALGVGWNDLDQVGLQGHKPNLDPLENWKASTGRKKNTPYPENYFKYSLWQSPTINRYLEKYGMVRSRLMVSHQKTCLSMHQDMSKRIHIPLITNPDCIMIIDNQVYHLEPGKIYLTDTTLKHTAVNASRKLRAHIVGCVYS